MYFLGTYQHNLDNKNRLNLPAKFVSKLDKSVVVNKGFDGCLELRSISEFETFSKKLMVLAQNKHDTRVVIRQLLANAADLEIDKAKRILIPTILLAEAHISKAITIIGVGNKIEIWDKSKYEDFKIKTDLTYESLAEKLNGGENDLK